MDKIGKFPGNRKNLQSVRSKFMDDVKTERSNKSTTSYTKPTSKWDDVIISKHDPKKENYSGVRSRFMDAVVKKQVNKPQKQK